MKEISDKEFDLMRMYIKKVCGVSIGDNKKCLITSRLDNRLKELGLESYTQYYEYLTRGASEESLCDLINRITTNHTFFMRESSHFKFLRDKILPSVKKNCKAREFRLWSAGCSTGEEAYNIAIVISEFLGVEKDRWQTDILATDISTDALMVAKSGIYMDCKVERLPDNLLKKYFKKISDREYRVKDELRRELILRRFNLLEKKYPFKKKFQVIFCRNVMIYFDEDIRNSVLDKFWECLEVGGYLFLGQTESLGRDDPRFKYVQPAVYRKG